jgi:hypothetical protein
LKGLVSAKIKLTTSGRKMAVELDSGHPLLPKTGWEDDDMNLILRTKWKHRK